MLTKNFYNLNMARLCQKNIDGAVVTGPDGTTYAGTYGNTYMLINFFNLRTDAPTVYNSQGVRIGSGTTPATADDYVLEKQLSSGFSISNQTAATIAVESDHLALSATYGITNTGTAPLTIAEVGYYGKGADSMLLLDRTVLETPIVINPGQGKQLTYTIRFNYPTE